MADNYFIVSPAFVRPPNEGRMNTYLKQLGKDICPSKGKWPVKRSKSAQVEFVPWRLVPDFPYLVLNTTAIRWIHVDVDLAPGWRDMPFHPAFDAAIFDQYNLQVPNFSVHSGDSYHMIWRLQKSLPLAGSKTSMSFLYDVRRKIVQTMSGDTSCPLRNVAFKNPAHKANSYRYWGDHFYYLDKLNIAVGSQKNTNWENAEYGKGQRNESTFRSALSWWKREGQKATLDELVDYIAAFQEGFHGIEPLSRAENISIATSILRNGDRYKTRADRNYGAMKLPKAKWREMSPDERREEIRRRKQLGAGYTNKNQKQSTREKIKASIEQLRGSKISARAIAEHSGLSHRTVRDKIKVKRGKVFWK